MGILHFHALTVCSSLVSANDLERGEAEVLVGGATLRELRTAREPRVVDVCEVEQAEACK